MPPGQTTHEVNRLQLIDLWIICNTLVKMPDAICLTKITSPCKSGIAEMKETQGDNVESRGKRLCLKFQHLKHNLASQYFHFKSRLLHQILVGGSLDSSKIKKKKKTH